MGDRYTWYEDCPECKGKETVEVYDAPSSYLFSRRCDKCNWTDGLNYYETGPQTIELLTKEQASARGVLYMSGLEAELSRNPETGEAANRLPIAIAKDVVGKIGAALLAKHSPQAILDAYFEVANEELERYETDN